LLDRCRQVAAIGRSCCRGRRATKAWIASHSAAAPWQGARLFRGQETECGTRADQAKSGHAFTGESAVSFRITGLPSKSFEHLYGKSAAELTELGVERHIADHKPGFPDRVSLREAEPGESVLLLNFEHQSAASPYRASHAIFVIEGERRRFDAVDDVPPVLHARLLSLRAFDARGSMLDADVVDGKDVQGLIERLFVNPDVHYIHAHYAKRGCYAARIDRA
jgi:hypothetical protein